MKKLTFSIFAATLAFGANADVESVDAAVASRCTYDGFFFGLGVSAVDTGVKTETTADRGAVGREGSAFPFAKIDDIGDLGIDTNDHDTRFTGNAVLGYGKRIKEKAYVAIEAGLDAGQNSNFRHIGMTTEQGKNFDVISKNNGLIPSVGLRLGYVHPETKNMVYLKAGAAYSQAKTTYSDYAYVAGYESTIANSKVYVDDITYSGKCSKWTPIVALGFEKVTGKNFRTRAEVEYRFQTTRSFDYSNNKVFQTSVTGHAKGSTAAEYSGTVKIYNKAAVTLRIMGIYTVK